MLNPVQNTIRTPIIFSLALLMPASLFFSRPVLAFAMLAFVLVTLLHPAVRQWPAQIKRQPLLLLIPLLFIVPLVSALWTSNQERMFFILQTKLPLLFFPLVFVLPFGFTQKQWFILALFFILLTTGGSLWSMLNYLTDPAAVHAGYLRSSSIKTPLENDHVRFSWMVSIAILLAVYMAWQISGTHRILFYMLTGIALWLIIFLHILAARTGLFSFYLFLLIGGISLVIRNIKGKAGWILLTVLVLLPATAYLSLPTFHNRVHYFFYELGFIRQDQYLRQSNDGNRIISYKAGWSVFRSSPVLGLGFGDVRDSVYAWYDQQYPGLEENEKIDPSSEYLLYAAGSGLPGLFVFCFVILFPFFIKIPERIPWLMIHAGLAAGFFFDIALETQFGVFLYLFVVLGWWKWAVSEKNEYLQRHDATVDSNHLQK